MMKLIFPFRRSHNFSKPQESMNARFCNDDDLLLTRKRAGFLCLSYRINDAHEWDGALGNQSSNLLAPN